MGTVNDTLMLDHDDLKTIKQKYPHGIFNKISDCGGGIWKYHVVIQVDNEEDYYYVLVDHCLAMSSKNFVNRSRNDSLFVNKMRKRVADIIKLYNVNHND